MAKRITLKKSGGKKRRTQRGGGEWLKPWTWFKKDPVVSTTDVAPPPPPPPKPVDAPVAAESSGVKTDEIRGTETTTQPASNNNQVSVPAKGGKRKRKSRGRARK